MDKRAALSILGDLLTEEQLEDLVAIAESGLIDWHAPPVPKAADFTDKAELDEALEARRRHLAAMSTGNHDALVAELNKNREAYARNLGRGALASKTPIDQREIDFKRGYFAGALFYLEVLPKQAERVLARRASEPEGGED